MNNVIKRILWIGQCSFQWGRMEFGNIGNYYIVEPLARQLHRVFPEAEIYTTNQFTEEFCEREKVKTVALELYYGFHVDELKRAKKELHIAEQYITGKTDVELTPYIEEVLRADIVIDLSGDMWGDNADLAAKDRFMVGVIKDKIAQLFKPTFMIAGSPGPFHYSVDDLIVAKEVFSKFALVTNRESLSRSVLKEFDFPLDNVEDYACPSFLFEPSHNNDFDDLVRKKFKNPQKPVIGMILCGWNFTETPFSKWPRKNEEFDNFLELVKYISKEIDCNLFLMSHSNGFPIPPQEFRLEMGRDYTVVKRLYELLYEEGVENVFLQDEVLDAWRTKEIISNFDMLISGRIHGAIAGLSQAVPTVILDYGMPPKTHKQIGMAATINADEFVVKPFDIESMKIKVNYCWSNKRKIKNKLKKDVVSTQDNARKQFDRIKEVLYKLEYGKES